MSSSPGMEPKPDGSKQSDTPTMSKSADTGGIAAAAPTKPPPTSTTVSAARARSGGANGVLALFLGAALVAL